MVDPRVEGGVVPAAEMRPPATPPAEAEDHLPGEISGEAVTSASRAYDLRVAVRAGVPVGPTALIAAREAGDVPGRGAALGWRVPAPVLPAHGPAPFAVRQGALHPIIDAPTVEVNARLRAGP